MINDETQKGAGAIVIEWSEFGRVARAILFIFLIVFGIIIYLDDKNYLDLIVYVGFIFVLSISFFILRLTISPISNEEIDERVNTNLSASLKWKISQFIFSIFIGLLALFAGILGTAGYFAIKSIAESETRARVAALQEEFESRLATELATDPRFISSTTNSLFRDLETSLIAFDSQACPRNWERVNLSLGTTLAVGIGDQPLDAERPMSSSDVGQRFVRTIPVGGTLTYNNIPDHAHSISETLQGSLITGAVSSPSIAPFEFDSQASLMPILVDFVVPDPQTSGKLEIETTLLPEPFSGEGSIVSYGVIFCRPEVRGSAAE